jgi:D-lactate dehydrogenase
MTFPNVVVCGHQAFFTEEALTEIAECTLSNLEEWIQTKTSKNSLTKDLKLRRRESLPVRAI